MKKAIKIISIILLVLLSCAIIVLLIRFIGMLVNKKVPDGGVEATVEEVLNYGAEKFIKCKVGASSVFVKTDKDYGGVIHLLPDFEKAGVIETERDIKII